MTGKHSHKNGFMNNGNSFNWNPQTFPKLLRKQGSTIRDLREVTPQGPVAGI